MTSSGGMRWLIFALTMALVAGVVTRRWGFAIGPEHRVREASVTLGPLLLAQLDADTQPDPVAAALAVSDATLHFGLGHTTSMGFDAPREGNCVEYSALFAALFNRAASTRHLDGHAWTVRSQPATVWGVPIPHRAFRDHDWTLVRIGSTLRYVDATFHDLWLDADVGGNVRDPRRTLLAPARAARDAGKARHSP